MDEKQDERLGWIWLWALVPVIAIAAITIGPMPLLRWFNGQPKTEPAGTESAEGAATPDDDSNPARSDAKNPSRWD